MLKKIKRLWWLLTWRRKLCGDCIGIYVIGNSGPCYECKEGNQFDPAGRYEEVEGVIKDGK